MWPQVPLAQAAAVLSPSRIQPEPFGPVPSHSTASVAATAPEPVWPGMWSAILHHKWPGPVNEG